MRIGRGELSYQESAGSSFSFFFNISLNQRSEWSIDRKGENYTTSTVLLN